MADAEASEVHAAPMLRAADARGSTTSASPPCARSHAGAGASTASNPNTREAHVALSRLTSGEPTSSAWQRTQSEAVSAGASAASCRSGQRASAGVEREIERQRGSWPSASAAQAAAASARKPAMTSQTSATGSAT